MGMHDRDWYQEHWLRNVVGVRRRELQRPRARGRLSFLPLFWVALLLVLVGSLVALLDVVKWLW